MGRKKAHQPTDIYIKLIIGSVVGFCIGYFMLNHIATWEEPLLGNTFHIVFGCIFIAVSLIVLGISVKQKYFPKKKKRRDRPIFLDEEKYKRRKSENS